MMMTNLKMIEILKILENFQAVIKMVKNNLGNQVVIVAEIITRVDIVLMNIIMENIIADTMITIIQQNGIDQGTAVIHVKCIDLKVDTIQESLIAEK